MVIDIAIAPSWQGSSRRVQVTRSVYTPRSFELPGTSRRERVEALGDRLEGVGAGRTQVYYISGELPKQLWLHYALPVQVRVSGAEFAAIQPQLALHAFGDSPIDAIMSLREELVDRYELLEAAGDRLSAPMARQREMLRKLLVPRDA
jgi:hypothetical protein